MRAPAHHLTIGAVTQPLHLRFGQQLVLHSFAKTGARNHSYLPLLIGLHLLGQRTLMTRVACYRVLDTEQYAMHHATGPQREHAGHQKREDVEQHHPDLVLTNIALTGVINRRDQREQGLDAEQVNRAKRAPQLQLTDKK